MLNFTKTNYVIIYQQQYNNNNNANNNTGRTSNSNNKNISILKSNKTQKYHQQEQKQEQLQQFQYCLDFVQLNVFNGDTSLVCPNSIATKPNKMNDFWININFTCNTLWYLVQFHQQQLCGFVFGPISLVRQYFWATLCVTSCQEFIVTHEQETSSKCSDYLALHWHFCIVWNVCAVTE